MDEFLGFLIVHLPVYISAFEGFMTLIILWHIEKDLEILIHQRSSIENEVKKLTVSLMGSLNDMRKIVYGRSEQNKNQK